jgi:hypothetical protein
MRARSVSVILNAVDGPEGSCPSGASAPPATVRLNLVDDDGDVIVDSFKSGFVCSAGEPTVAKFAVRFLAPENCRGSVAPDSAAAAGRVSIVATTPAGSWQGEGQIECQP